MYSHMCWMGYVLVQYELLAVPNYCQGDQINLGCLMERNKKNTGNFLWRVGCC